jgi:hypothetical protein
MLPPVRTPAASRWLQAHRAVQRGGSPQSRVERWSHPCRAATERGRAGSTTADGPRTAKPVTDAPERTHDAREFVDTCTDPGATPMPADLITRVPGTVRCTSDGVRIPVGPREGSTEHATVATACR